MPSIRKIPLFGPHVRVGDVAMQAAWHKHDFILVAVVLISVLGWAVSVLARAKMGIGDHSPLLVAACSALVAFAGYILSRQVAAMRRRSAALSHLPGPKYPFLSGFMALVRRKDVHRFGTELAEQYGPIFKFRILCYHAVCITDPVLATEVLRSKVVDKLRFQYSFLDPFLGGTNMLSGHTNEHWKAVRKAVAPAFSAGDMRFALGHIVDRSMALVEYLRESGPEKIHNVDNLLLRESMDVIGRFGFQREMNALGSLKSRNPEEGRDVDALLHSTQEIEKRLQEINRWWRLWKPDVWRGWVTLGRFKTIVQQLLDHIKANQLQPGSFADLLLRAKDPKTGRPLSEEQMFPEIAALFFAGIDTTGHTGTFVLYLISQHPEVEAKILDELESLGLMATPERPQPRQLEYSDLNRLPYLQAVIKEALRMYPPVSIGQVRVSNSHDITLGGRLLIPAGTAIWVPHHTIQNVSFNWDEPDKFKPDRWLTPGTEYAIPEKLPLPRDWYKHWDAIEAGAKGSVTGLTDADIDDGDSKRPKRYFPFAEGPRNCVGQSLAKISLLATTATLLQHFTFKLADEMGGPEGVRATEQYTLVVGLTKGMLMHAIPRDSPTIRNGRSVLRHEE